MSRRRLRRIVGLTLLVLVIAVGASGQGSQPTQARVYLVPVSGLTLEDLAELEAEDEVEDGEEDEGQAEPVADADGDDEEDDGELSPEELRAAARSLAALGLHDEARQLLIEKVQESPELYGAIDPEQARSSSELSESEEDLARLVGGPWRWWRERRTTAFSFLRLIVELLALLLVALLLLALLRPLVPLPLLKFFLHWPWRSRFKIDDFVADDSAGIAGPDFSSRVGGYLVELGQARGDASTQLVTAPGEAVALPDSVSEISSQATALVEVFKTALDVVRPQPIEVTGTLHDGGPGGPTAVVQLAHRKRVIAVQTLRVLELGGSKADLAAADGEEDERRLVPAFDLLAEATAVWLLFQLKKPSQRIAGLGTAQWRAFALLRAGVRSDRKGDSRSALTAFSAALQEAPEFAAARSNLGRQLLKMKDRDAARVHLRAAVRAS